MCSLMPMAKLPRPSKDGLHAAEVANARHRDGDQTVEEFIHAVAAQRHLGAKRHFFANLEARDGFLRDGCDGVLAGDRGQVFLSRLRLLAVADGFCTARRC